MMQLQSSEAQANKNIEQYQQQVERSKHATAELASLQQVQQQQQTIAALRKTIADNDVNIAALQRQQAALKKSIDDDTQVQQLQQAFADVPVVTSTTMYPYNIDFDALMSS
ncbi:hypothetical protein ACJMK2_025537 [Sinanodonta woodiana]|uniref:Uncharacterized protein n=1 Tax=Sinanodonta woodiana TaxID=1069815 RepID=A0ABD3XGW8_SINWO